MMVFLPRKVVKMWFLVFIHLTNMKQATSHGAGPLPGTRVMVRAYRAAHTLCVPGPALIDQTS